MTSKQRVTCALVILVLSPSTIIASPARDVVGIVHIGGFYTFNPNWDWSTYHAKSNTDPTWDPAWGSPDYLNEGAREIQQLGTRIIKIWFHPNMLSWYPFTDPAYPQSR